MLNTKKIVTIYRPSAVSKIHSHSIRTLDLEQLSKIFEGWGDTALVAFFMQVSAGVVRKWIKDGKIKAKKGPDKKWYICLEDIKDLFFIDDALQKSKKAYNPKTAIQDRRVKRVVEPAPPKVTRYPKRRRGRTDRARPF